MNKLNQDDTALSTDGVSSAAPATTSAAETAATEPDKSAGQSQPQAEDTLGALDVVKTVLAAGLGVQSSKNRERDFKQGRAGVFIAAGFIATALFIGLVLTVVQVVLKSTGS